MNNKCNETEFNISMNIIIFLEYNLKLIHCDLKECRKSVCVWIYSSRENSKYHLNIKVNNP